MRCSTSEGLFDGRLEGALSVQQGRALDAHLASCPRCRSVLEELRVIDALLLTPRALEPAPNFTFRTMAEIRTMPPPKRARSRRAMWTMLALYLVLSWGAIGAWLAVGRPDGHAFFALALAVVHHVAGAFDGVARGIAATGIGGIVGVVFVFDVILFAGALYAGVVLRPRIIARLARSERV